ncbi:MAG: glycosyltransferase family 2 protein [Paludibacteraceae bacterium]|nr:glycosyltransferase family 2 protein [Paludibacteraceae bacterium]
MKTEVIILNYNGVKLMEHYLGSVVKSVEASENIQVTVADNGSDDGSKEWLKEHYPTVRLIEMEKNWGFAEGYNKAIKKSDAEYVVLLNSDVETPKGWLEPMTDYMDKHKECAACQPKVLADKRRTHFEYAGAAGGFIDRYGYPFCRGRVMDNVEEDHGQYDNDVEVFWCTGACLMIRRNVYVEIGGLDSRFFAHQEEIDLCWRLKARGWSVMCIGKSIVYHLGGGSLGYESPRKTYLNFRNNRLMLYKNLDKKEYGWIAFARLWLDLAAILQMILSGKTGNAKATIKALRDFNRIKPEFETSRNENIKLRTKKNIDERLNFLLIWQVYMHKKKKYEDLIKK